MCRQGGVGEKKWRTWEEERTTQQNSTVDKVELD